MEALLKIVSRLAILAAFALPAIFPGLAPAQTVAVQGGGGEGHGLMIRSGGSCYLLTPRHVVGTAPSASVRTAAPAATGRAFVERPFWEGMDLALGVLRGALEGRCELRLEDLAGETRLEAGGAAELVSLRGSGEVERRPMRISESAYLTLEAEFVRPEDEVFEGVSGSFLFIGAKPVGMAVEATGQRSARFVRIEEIHANAARWIGRRGAVFAASTAPEGPSTAIASEAPELPVRLERAAPPLSAQFAAANMLADGPQVYVFQPQGRNQLAFRLEGDGAKPLSRVTLVTDSEGGHALPQDILVEITTREDGGGAPRFFASGRMAPDGRFDQKRSPVLARWVYVTISTAWSEGPVRVDRIRFE